MHEEFVTDTISIPEDWLDLERISNPYPSKYDLNPESYSSLEKINNENRMKLGSVAVAMFLAPRLTREFGPETALDLLADNPVDRFNRITDLRLFRTLTAIDGIFEHADRKLADLL